MHTFEGLRIRIDRARCIGMGNRVNVTAEIFEIDRKNLVRFQEETSDIDAEQLKEACTIYLVDALRVYDGDEQVVP